MCISSNWVNDAQDSIAIKKFSDFQNSLIPNVLPPGHPDQRARRGQHHRRGQRGE